MVIGVALIGVIGVAFVDAFIAVIITTKEIMRASPRHSRQAFQADRQCGDMGKRRALAVLQPTRAPSHRRRRTDSYAFGAEHKCLARLASGSYPRHCGKHM